MFIHPGVWFGFNARNFLFPAGRWTPRLHFPVSCHRRGKFLVDWSKQILLSKDNHRSRESLHIEANAALAVCKSLALRAQALQLSVGWKLSCNSFILPVLQLIGIAVDSWRISVILFPFINTRKEASSCRLYTFLKRGFLQACTAIWMIYDVFKIVSHRHGCIKARFQCSLLLSGCWILRGCCSRW